MYPLQVSYPKNGVFHILIGFIYFCFFRNSYNYNITNLSNDMRLMDQLLDDFIPFMLFKKEVPTYLNK